VDAGTIEATRFRDLVAPLFEDAPRFLDRLEAGLPYGSWEDLFSRAWSLALDMPTDEQTELIDAHPRVGAPADSVSALSFVEQAYDEATASNEAQAEAESESERARIAAELDLLNKRYEATFGFRYVIFVAGRSRAEIVPLLRAALDADPAAERERALRNVVSIARDRAIKTGLMTDHSAAQ